MKIQLLTRQEFYQSYKVKLDVTDLQTSAGLKECKDAPKL